MSKKKVIIIGIVSVILAAVIFSLILLFNPALSLNLSGKAVIYTEDLEFEGRDYTIYVTEKGETLGINAYTNDGFLGAPRNISFGTSDKGYGNGFIPATGVKNGRPFTDVMFIHIIKSGVSIDIDEEIIETKEFVYNGDSYSLVYTE